MKDSGIRFPDRGDAGRQLAARLAALAPEEPVVYALPRGGVPVAVEIARTLRARLLADLGRGREALRIVEDSLRIRRG